MIDAPISQQSQTIKILLLAHNASSRVLLDDYLSYQGYQVLSLAQESSLRSVLVQFQPHVVLLDLNLSGSSRYQLLEEMRQQLEPQNIPVIVITGFAFRTKSEPAVGLRASYSIVKPIQLELLAQLLQEACAGSFARSDAR